MTRRFWRFSAIALIGIIVVAATLAISYGRLNINNLMELSADKNTVLARSLSNAARVQLLALLQQSSERDLLEIRAAAAASDLPEIMTRQVRELSVFKVNVFNRGGVAVFSTDPALIGIRFPQNPGIVSALNGASVSDIVRENSLNSFDKVIESHDLIQTYIPFLSDNGTLIGVFEVYSDITPFLTRVAETRRDIVVGVSAILTILYALLVGLYARTDQRLVKEQVATQGYLKQIESVKGALEVRVAKRTRLLKESRDFLQTAMDGVPDPAFVIDRNYRIKSMNKAARETFSTALNTGEPIHCYSVMHGLDVPCGDAGRQCTLKSGLPCKINENVERSNGDFQHVEFRTTPLRAANGEITGAIEIAHDLNEREQVAFKLRQAQETAETESRVKSEFVATMSHEIRTPMNAVLGMTDLLRLTHLTRKQQGYIQTIQSSGNMLLSLVDNILDFTKMGASALVIQNREFSVNELLECVLEIIGNLAYSKGLELVGFLDVNLSLKVSGDRNRLRQILVNLAGNAVKFSDHGEVVIRIGAESEKGGGTSLLFSVSDSGIGMTNEVTTKIFTPFANVADQGAGTQQGSGLGLVICKQLVEQMGGKIGVESKHGEGTKVWFTVPVERRAPSGDESTASSTVLQGKRILAVHRNAVIDQAICAYATAEGMSCDVVAKDDVALERLQACASSGEPYAAVIIDISLHDTGGLSLARHIRAADNINTLPIVLLAPISKPLKPGGISSIGRVRCINKPILPSEFSSSLVQLIDPGKSTVDVMVSSNDAGDDNAALRILVAEDNPVNRQVLTGMLESLGYIADCVENGPAVLDAMAQKSYELLLMDCQMPGMDGEQVSEEIRNNEGRLAVQPIIVALTADASLEHRSACLAAGMDDFIAKPIRLEKLRNGMRKWKSLLAMRADDANHSSNDPQSMAEQELLAKLHARVGAQDEQFLGNYIDLFLNDTVERLVKLSDALAQQDTAALTRECHSLKGACLEFGVDRMGKYCDDLSDSASNGNLDEVQDLLHTLSREFKRIKPVFEAEKDSRATRS